MGFTGFGLGEAKARNQNNSEWIGPGNHRLELTKFKQTKGDTFAEFKVLSTRDRGPNKTGHAPGDAVSTKFATGGTGAKSERALVDLKTFLVAAVQSAGGDPHAISAPQWDELADAMLVGAADGIHLDCGAYYPTDKDTGQPINFTRLTWTPVASSPKKPDLFKGFGFSTGAKTAAAPPASPPATPQSSPAGAPPSRPGARPPSRPAAVDPKKKAEVLDALHEWHRDGLSREQVEDESGDYRPWGVALVGASVYAELVGQVFDLPPGL